MAGSELPATSRPICESTSSPEVNPNILCSPFIRGFSQPPTRFDVWARAGLSTGEMTIASDDRVKTTTDIDMKTSALGPRR